MTPRGRTASVTTWLAGALALGMVSAVVGSVVAFRASAVERRRPLPGDALVPDPLYVTTQAVTIDASPDGIWPWLAQLGAGRAGWYSYDRVDNDGRASAEAIRPDLQHVSPGDVFPALPGATDAFVVAVVEPPGALVLTVPSAAGTVMTWAFVLIPQRRRRTRLVVRARVAKTWRVQAADAPSTSQATGVKPRAIERVYPLLARLPGPLLLATGGLGHRVMQNVQLRGIRRRAERAGRMASPPVPVTGVWSGDDRQANPTLAGAGGSRAPTIRRTTGLTSAIG